MNRVLADCCQIYGIYIKTDLACSQRGVCDVTLECSTSIEPGHPSCTDTGALDQPPSEVTGS